MALTHMPCQLLLWVKLAQTHWTPGWRVEMLVSTESQHQPAIAKHNVIYVINALYTSSTHFPICKLFLCEIFPTKRLCFNAVLECTLNARETLPCAPSDVRSSWTWKWRCNIPGACQLFDIQVLTLAIILSLAKVALKSPLVSTVDRFVLESVLILKKAQ